MLKSLPVAAALALAPALASAGFLGLSIREDKTPPPAAVPAGVRLFNVYAEFSEAGIAGPSGFMNMVRSVGTPIPPIVGPRYFGIDLATNPGAYLYQAPPESGARVTAPDLAFNDPRALYDTYVGIRLKSINTSTGPDFFDNTALNSDFAFVDTNSDGLQDRLISGWGANPGTFQGFAVANTSTGGFEVFIGQFAVVGATGPHAGIQGPLAPGVQFTTESAFVSPIFTGSLVVSELQNTLNTHRINFVPPPPSCPADLDADGQVSSTDLAALLGSWGSTGPADLDNSGGVNAADLAAMLGAWGPC